VTVSSIRSQREVGRGAPRDLALSSTDVIAVFGPTASGKTAVAEALADRLGTEVVSADALQVYRGLEILTNQPTRPARLVGIRALDEEMSVGEYAVLAQHEIDELVELHGVAVVAGGTGLYLRAALIDLGIPPAPAEGARKRWERVYDESPAVALAELAARDPAASRSIHRNDRRRIVRALELAEAGSSLVPADGNGLLWAEHVRRPTLVVGLDVPPAELERRIRARVDAMLAAGAATEAEAARRAGASRTASRALGLTELTTLSPAQAREQMVIRTRRYAAYQRKWMRRIPNLVALDATRPLEEVVDEIVDLARAR
jgi:tRNA dimethylallyltransferase